ncbi:hypothetical protein FRC03_004410, partial [Tulasnella sp. 419]
KIQKGDVGFLGYSGHAIQLSRSISSNHSELDGRDEAIIPIDDAPGARTYIVDNDLNDWLVAPLPAGATLLVALDCCASETLLDLPYRYALTQTDNGFRLQIEPAHHKNKGGQGRVLCISACKDDQQAPEIRNKHTGEVFGAMTALLYHLFNHGSIANGASNVTPMRPPSVQQILTELRSYFDGQASETTVQITTSQPLPEPDPVFGDPNLLVRLQ